MSLIARYRGHLILVKAYQASDDDRWIGAVRIQFNEDNLTFRDVELTESTARFATAKRAEKYALKEGKKWVDNRVHQLKLIKRKDSRVQLPRRIIWITVAFIGFSAIGFFTMYLQKEGLLEEVFRVVEAVLAEDQKTK
jgi:hypothetical protein